MIEKYVIITHSDLDGIGTPVLANLLRIWNKRAMDEDDGPPFDIILTEPKDVDTAVKPYLTTKSGDYDFLFISDLFVSEEVAEMIEKFNNDNGYYKIRLFDHHKNGVKYLSKYDWACSFDMLHGRKTSATEIFFEYYVRETINWPKLTRTAQYVVEDFVKLVTLWDSWEWMNDKVDGLRAKDLNMLMSVSGNKLTFLFDIVVKLLTEQPLVSEEDKEKLEIIEEQKQIYIKNKTKNIFMRNIDGYVFGFICADKYASELGDAICSNNSNVDISGVISVDFNQVSLRTKKDIDLSKIAAKYGGGGHPKAAGFPVKVNLLAELLNSIF